VAEGYGSIYLPGEMEYENKEARLKSGIPLAPSTVKMLKELGEQLSIQARFT